MSRVMQDRASLLLPALIVTSVSCGSSNSGGGVGGGGLTANTQPTSSGAPSTTTDSGGCRGYFPPPPHDRPGSLAEQDLMISVRFAPIAPCFASSQARRSGYQAGTSLRTRSAAHAALRSRVAQSPVSLVLALS